MAHKAFYVTRTENEQTHTAGAATLNRADTPQLIKIFDTADDIDPTALETNEVVGTKESDFEAVSIVDRVAVDNMNPITSNAVASHFTLGAIEEIVLSNSTATPTEISEPGFIIVSCDLSGYMNNSKKQTALNINGKELHICALDIASNNYAIMLGTTTIPVAAGDLVACYGKNGSGSNPPDSTKLYFRPFGFIA